MKYKDIQELTTKELKDLLADENISLTKTKVAHTVSPVDNPSKIKESKKTIAKIKTELKKRQITSKLVQDGK
jgi:large subunit ribosomal protein L29